MTADEDTALIAGQLAELTQKVNEMAKQLEGLREGARTHWSAQTPSKNALTLPREN